MADYNFRKETRLFLAKGNALYSIDIYPDINYSQTFTETEIKVKTLHDQLNVIDAAVITKANPANFNFTVPIVVGSEMDVLLQNLMSWNTAVIEAALIPCDLYIVNSYEIYKLEKAVFETGTFQISQDSLVLLSIEGTAAKLSKVAAIPSNLVLQARSADPVYFGPGAISVTLNGTPQDYITAITLELQNKVNWLDYATIHSSTNITDASGTMYPEAFVVSGRVLSGTLMQHVTSDTNNVQTWSTSQSLSVKLAPKAGDTWVMEFNIPSIVFTNRVDASNDILIKSYDFRMNTNVQQLSDIIIKR